MTVHRACGFIGVALLVMAPGAAAAQTCPTAPPGDTTAAVVFVVARVHAEAVVFHEDPDVRVTVNGCEPAGDQIRYTSNLPDPVVPAIRYTDVEVRAEYRARVILECRAPGDAAAELCESIGITTPGVEDTINPTNRGRTPSDGGRD